MQLSAFILWVTAPSGFQGVGSNNMPKVWTIKGDIMEHVPSHKIFVLIRRISLLRVTVRYLIKGWVPDKLTNC